MFKYFLLMLIVITTGTSGVMFYVRTIFNNTLLVQNKLQTIATLNRIKNSVIFKNGQYYLPYGVNKTDHHELPVSFSGSRTTTTGIPYVYCPYSTRSVISQNDTVQLTSTKLYKVTTSTTISDTTIPYVTNSDASPVSNVLAFLIVPNNILALPSCSDVSVNTASQFVLNNNSLNKGEVYAVLKDELNYGNREGDWYYVKKTPTGSNINQVFSAIAQHPSKDAVVILEAGQTYNLSSNYIVGSKNKNTKRHITLKSSIVNSPAVITSVGNKSAVFNDIVLTLNNISFTGVLISASRAKLDIISSHFTQAHFFDSSLYLDNVTFGENTATLPVLELSQSTVKHTGGDVIFNGGGGLLVSLVDSKWYSVSSNIKGKLRGLSIFIQLENSQFSQRNSNISLNTVNTGQALFFVDNQSKLSWFNVLWSENGSINYGIYNEGVTSFNGSTLKPTNKTSVAIYTEQGSTLSLTNSSIGSSGTSNKPSIGLMDNLSTSISGNVNIYANVCKQGGRFDDTLSFVVQDDTVVAVYLDGSVVPMVFPESFNINMKRFFAPIILNCL